MNCKIDKIRAAWAAGDRIGALRIAARFYDRSVDTLTFKRGMAAHDHPELRDFAAGLDHWPTAGAALSVTTGPTRALRA
jgi:hypothetical protein